MYRLLSLALDFQMTQRRMLFIISSRRNFPMRMLDASYSRESGGSCDSCMRLASGPASDPITRLLK